MAVSVVEFQKAIKSLEEALNFSLHATDETQFKIARDASIQRFEFCIELAWKSSAKILGSSSTTAKPVIREMAQNGLINSPELWFDFVEARNRTSHSYDENVAQQVFLSAKNFIAEGKSLLEKLLLK